MPEPDDPIPPPRRFRSKTQVASAFCASGLALIVLAWIAFDLLAKHRLESARAAYAAHGISTSLKEFLGPEPDDPAQNAMPYIEQAFDQAYAKQQRPGSNPELFQRIEEAAFRISDARTANLACDPQDRDNLRSWLQDPMIDEACRMLQTAAQCPVLLAGVDYGAGPAATGPHVETVLRGVRLLCWRSRYVPRSAPGGSWFDIEAAMDLGDLCAEGPTLIDSLVGAASWDIAMQTALEICETHPEQPPPPEMMQRLHHALDTHPGWLARSIEGDTLIITSWLDRTLEEQPDTFELAHDLLGLGPRLPRPVSATLSVALQPYICSEVALMHDYRLEAVLNARKPVREAAPRWAALDAKITADAGWISGLCVPRYSRMAGDYANHIAKIQTTIVALEAIRYKLRTNTFPESIDALGLPASVVIDLRSGRPLTLQIGPNSITVTADDPHKSAPGSDPASDSTLPENCREVIATIRLDHR